MKLDYRENRQKIIDWTKQQLIGNYRIEDNVLKGNPLSLFHTGFLAAISKDDSEFEEVESINEDQANHNSRLGDEGKPAQKTLRYMPPSSAGFSFYVAGDNVELRVYYNAFGYKDIQIRSDIGNQFLKERDQRWKKIPLTDDGLEIVFTPSGDTQQVVLGGKARINCLWRKQKDGFIVTLTISNMQQLSESDERKKALRGLLEGVERAKSTLFEVELKCIVENSEVRNYPSVDKELLSDEEREIELRYKDNSVLAIGHGVGTNWMQNNQNQTEIWIDFMPCIEIPATSTEIDTNKEVLKLDYLKDPDNETIVQSLNEFVENYKKWGDGQNSKANDESKDDIDTAKKIVEKQQICMARMLDGVDLIDKDPLIRKSFALANEVMSLQMKQDKKIENPEWRPFQLGFILMVLESTIDKDGNSQYRDTLDLIWFPTGGGKTEAYLGLMVLQFIYRRFRYPASSGGTVAIMRYTLRLLCAQQFLRATKAICALELIRKERVNELGKEIFSVGLWVGGSVTPNTFYQAYEQKKEGKLSKYILQECPWCSDRFKAKNYVVTEKSFHFTCTNKDCDFGKETDNILPCNVVDYALYENPPSLLIATVDKFARLTWTDKPSVFFKSKNNKPPELIIQDELHLISGALGSIVGLYEVAIDSIITSLGVPIKYIASTATIKNAEKQVRLLFARDMCIFPPSGLRSADSYFARTESIDEKPGRMYVGFLAYHFNRQRCIMPIASTLLAAPNYLFSEEKDYLDSWWTQVVYHSSQRELGNNLSLFNSEIKNYLKGIKVRLVEFDKTEQRSDTDKDDPRYKERTLNIKTLFGKNPAKKNQETFSNLELSKDKDASIDVALCTELISVGVDVDRLTLMIINGQPFTTAEYIQASSRIGRSDVPGMVFVNYYKTQSRSLSHYENFRSYHDSFYRHVEPSSITPFTNQARGRAIHAMLVSVLRHSQIGLLGNKNAEDFSIDNDEVKKIVKIIKNRCKKALIDNDSARKEVDKNIDEITKLWNSTVEQCKAQPIGLVYNNKENGLDKSSETLLCDFNNTISYSDSGPPWPTLQSMRNIEYVGAIEIIEPYG